MSDQRLPYPPCENFIFCPGKDLWPELVGKPGHEAAAVIERENPYVNAVIVKPGEAMVDDWCCNRVWVEVDGNGNVKNVPLIASAVRWGGED